VLVVHKWWGHNDYARKRAEMLAELAYTALAVDMYGEGKTAEQIAAFCGEMATAKFNMDIAYHPEADRRSEWADSDDLPVVDYFHFPTSTLGKVELGKRLARAWMRVVGDSVPVELRVRLSDPRLFLRHRVMQE